MTKQEADFIGSMNMCDEISNEAYKKIMCNCEVEEEECEDCISRQAVLDMMQMRIGGKELYKAVYDLPSVTPQQRWIPVSERLPEDYIHVLCQFTLGGMGECYLAHGAFHVVGGLVMTCNEVIAWMPLPEPYKAKMEGDND